MADRQVRGGRKGGNDGVVSFYREDETAGFKIGPETVLACSLIFIGLVVVMHILGKFTS